jgi:hypothetical protein
MKDIKDNIFLYTEQFIKEGIIAFTDAHLTYEEQEELTYIFNNQLGSYPSKPGDTIDRYFEDHSSRIQNVPKDGIILAWHIENAFFDNPVVAGV